MRTTRVYESTLIAPNGRLSASTMTLQGFPDSTHGSASRWFLDGAGFEITERWLLGADSGPSAHEALEQLVSQAANENPSLLDIGNTVAAELIDEVLVSPIVITESSPASGKALSAIFGQAGAAYIAVKTGSAFLVISYQGALVFVWFVAGPITGARDGIKDAAHRVSEEHAETLFRSWIERRLNKKKNRR